MKVIYALFDDGAQSVFNTFKDNHDFAVYSFGIQEKETVIKCDLSDLERFFMIADCLPKPDLIFANPPCETFSTATNGTFPSGKTGNMYYYHDLNPITDFDDWINGSNQTIKHLVHNREQYFESLQVTREVHEKLHKNTEKIIKHFNVPFAIENPMRSLCFKKFYQNSDELLEVPYFYDAITYYTAYDSTGFEKPTRIRSSSPLSLRKKPSFRPSKIVNKSYSYNEKSAMPHDLIRSIVKQLLD